MQQIQKKARVDWIDLCKFMGIFCMVWAHAGDSRFIDKYIHIFHMPIFFFLSGFTFWLAPNASFASFTLKKAKSLLLPYFVFAFIQYFIWWIFYQITGQTIGVTLGEFVQSTLSSNTIHSPFSSVQWFLTCLFLIEILFYTIMKALKPSNRTLLIVLILFSILGYDASHIFHQRLIWGFDTALTGIVFFGAGFLAHKALLDEWIGKLTNLRISLVTAFLFSAGFVTGMGNMTVNLRTITYGNYFLFYCSSFLTVCAIVCLSTIISRCRWKTTALYQLFLYIGKYSLVVLLLNQLYIQMFKKLPFVARFYEHTSLNPNLAGLLLAFIVLAVMLPAIQFLAHIAPSLIGKPNSKH